MVKDNPLNFCNTGNNYFIRDMPYFTVFTPCYNGGKYFHRVLHSMLAQTNKDWEWIIIDDGSTDNSFAILQDSISEYPDLNIRIFRFPENQGKHIAFNKAIEIAKGVLFVPADIDDTFVPRTLSFFREKWEENLRKKLDLSGITVLCYRGQQEYIVGHCFPNDCFVTNALDLSFVHKVRGEKWGCLSLDVLRNYRFPLWTGLVNEGYLWFSIAKKYNLICYNIALRNYHETEGGLMAGNHKSVISVKNQIAQMKYQGWFLVNFWDYLILKDPVLLLKKTLKLILLFAKLLPIRHEK